MSSRNLGISITVVAVGDTVSAFGALSLARTGTNHRPPIEEKNPATRGVLDLVNQGLLSCERPSRYSLLTSRNPNGSTSGRHGAVLERCPRCLGWPADAWDRHSSLESINKVIWINNPSNMDYTIIILLLESFIIFISESTGMVPSGCPLVIVERTDGVHLRNEANGVGR